MKRAIISDRFVKLPSSSSSAPPGGESRDLSLASAKRKIGNLKKEARGLAEDSSRISSTIEERKKTLSDITCDLEEVTIVCAQSEGFSGQLQIEINELLYQQQLNQERISYRQNYVRRLKDLSGTRAEPSQSVVLERRLLSSSQSLDNVIEIIIGLKSVHPHLTDVLQRVIAMANPNIGSNHSRLSSEQE